LNALTSPFGYILFKETEQAPAKLALYAKKDAAEQLRKIHGVSVIPKTTTQEVTEDFATTRLSLMDKTGRTDTATGIVYLWKKYNNQPYRLSGQRLGDAIMKSETKAKRRGTLSICGLGILDEMDLESVRVVGGVTPDGRIYQFAPPVDAEDVPPSHQLDENAAHGHPEGSERAKQAEAALKRVEEADKAIEPEKTSPAVPKAQPAPPMEFKGKIEIDCTIPSPIVRGDLQDIIGILQQCFPDTFKWGEDSWWHIAPECVSELVDLLSKNGFKVDVKIKTPPPSSSGQKGKPAMAPSPPAEARGSGADSGRDQSAASPTVVSGTIERVNSGMAGKAPVKQVTLLQAGGKKAFLGCFHKSPWDELEKGLSQLASFPVITKGQFTNIEGLIKIGSKEWLEDGTPVVQNKDREAGGRTLFP